MKRTIIGAALTLLMMSGVALADETPNAEQKKMIDNVFKAFLFTDICKVSVNGGQIKTDLAKVGLTADDINEKSRFKSYLDVANIKVQRDFHEAMDGMPKEVVCLGAAVMFGSGNNRDTQNWLCCFRATE